MSLAKQLPPEDAPGCPSVASAQRAVISLVKTRFVLCHSREAISLVQRRRCPWSPGAKETESCQAFQPFEVLQSIVSDLGHAEL